MDLYAILSELVAERKRIDHLIQALENFENGMGVTPARGLKLIADRPTRGRKSMGKSEREEVSRRMKEYWSARRQAIRDGTKPSGRDSTI